MESNPESIVVDFSKMTVLEIKKFLVERGVSVNGYHKPSLRPSSDVELFMCRT